MDGRSNWTLFSIRNCPIWTFSLFSPKKEGRREISSSTLKYFSFCLSFSLPMLEASLSFPPRAAAAPTDYTLSGKKPSLSLSSISPLLLPPFFRRKFVHPNTHAWYVPTHPAMRLLVSRLASFAVEVSFLRPMFMLLFTYPCWGLLQLLYSRFLALPNSNCYNQPIWVG